MLGVSGYVAMVELIEFRQSCFPVSVTLRGILGQLSLVAKLSVSLFDSRSILLACVWTIDIWTVVRSSCYLILFLLYWLQRLAATLVFKVIQTSEDRFFSPILPTSLCSYDIIDMYTHWPFIVSKWYCALPWTCGSKGK